MDIGSNIKKFRTVCGYTQKELAEKIGISYQQIGQYETGKRRPKAETLKKIANALNIKTDALYGHKRVTIITEEFLKSHPYIEKSMYDYVQKSLFLSDSSIVNQFFEKEDISKMSLKEKANLYNCCFDHIDYSEENIINLYPVIPPDYFKTIDEYSTLFESYKRLNDLGKEEALKRISELTEIEKYTKF